MTRKKRYGMTPCRVETLPFGPWLVRFVRAEHQSIFLQIDTDQAAFAVNAGAIAAPNDWDGSVDALALWENFDPETIRFCSEEYLSL